VITLEQEDTIKLDFLKNSEHPDRVFGSLQKAFEHVILFQSDLIHSIDPLIDIRFFLLGIRPGSIFSDYVKKIIYPEQTDPVTARPEPKGNLLDFVNQSQGDLLGTVDTKPNLVINNDTVSEIQERVIKNAQTSGVASSPNFRAISKTSIADSVLLLEEATHYLREEETYTFTNGNVVETKVIRRIQTKIDKQAIKMELANTFLETPIHMRLKVKIADFLGKSRWKFKLEDGTTIEAKILDETWLYSFHTKNQIIGPGDSIEIKGKMKELFDKYGNVVDTEYTIENVIRIHEANEQREFEN